MPSAVMESPVGRLGLFEQDGALVRLGWSPGPHCEATALLNEAVKQLEAYFAGELRVFDLPMAPAGSPFQQQVYAAMSAIPFGQTRTYGEIAADLKTFGQPVGQACGSNPIAIVIPCHRVLAAGGTGGYSGANGVETKIALLRHEDAYPYLL